MFRSPILWKEEARLEAMDVYGASVNEKQKKKRG